MMRRLLGLPRRVRVTREEFGDAWPLTVDAAHLSCPKPNTPIVEVEGTGYALNGVAKTR